jgi:hypothetical protein
MTDTLFDHLCGITAVILFIWSAVLVWASWQIGCMFRSLANERRELRRWKRLSRIYEKQREPWN